MNEEGPFRPLPKDDSIFGPEKHEKTVHKKLTGKDTETWVRKSVVESEKGAVAEARKRNAVVEKPNWFTRLFGKSNEETALSIAQEEALEKELAGIEFYWSSSDDLEEGREKNNISGTYNGHKLSLNKDGHFITGSIDEIHIPPNDAKKIWKKIQPLLEQRQQNRGKLKKIHTELETRKPILEVLGKLPPRKTSELEEPAEQEQLGPKTEE